MMIIPYSTITSTQPYRALPVRRQYTVPVLVLGPYQYRYLYASRLGGGGALQRVRQGPAQGVLLQRLLQRPPQRLPSRPSWHTC